MAVMLLAAVSCILSFAQEDSEYDKMLKSLDQSYAFMSIIPNYSYTASEILEALPKIESKEGKSSFQYCKWVYRLAVCKYRDNRYSEVIPILDGFIKDDLAKNLQEEDLFQMYDIFIASLVRVEVFPRAERLSAEILQEAKAASDKKYLVMSLIRRYMVRSIDPATPFDEL